MTTYTLPEVPHVTIERNRREVRLVRQVRGRKTGSVRQLSFRMANAIEALEIGYALLRVAEDMQQEDREMLEWAQTRYAARRRRGGAMMTAGEKTLLVPVCLVLLVAALSWRFFFIALGAAVLIAYMIAAPCKAVDDEDR